MKKLLRSFIAVAIITLSLNSQAQNFTRLTINTDSIGSTPANFVAVGSTLYFTAYDGAHGTELWKSDGTAAGTMLVKDINPGPANTPISLMTSFNGLLFFRAYDPTDGYEMWKTDGTAAGTVLLKDINPGSASGLQYGGPVAPIVFNNALYFGAATPAAGYELWKTDGTAAGTVMVKDIVSGTTSSLPQQFAICNNTLYFVAQVTTGGTQQLWKTDGTATGTVQATPGSTITSIFSLTAANTKLYMFAGSATSGGICVSDGTTAGTTILSNPASLLIGTIGTVGDTAFYVSTGTVYKSDYELWKSDGTVAGTTRVKDIYPGPTNSITLDGDKSGVVMGNHFYFSANDSLDGAELWKSDGTAAGTVMVKNIMPGKYTSSITSLYNLNGTLYFSADDGTNGMELWKSDGTTAGTVMVTNINAGAYGSYPAGISAFNNTVVFSATDGSNGMELWKSDGTATGTTMVSNILVSPYEKLAPGVPLASALPANNGLFFTGNDDKYGQELYFTAGTPGSTAIVKDIFPGSASSTLSYFPSALAQINPGATLFNANDGASGEELWTTDGTTAGTGMIKDIGAGVLSSAPNSLTNINGSLYFAATIDGSTYNVYKTNGTGAGTVLLQNITSLSIPYFASVNGNVLFTATTTAYGSGLWKTDGTVAGTMFLKSLNFPSTPQQSVVINNILYFVASNDANGFALWKSDGTYAGTVFAIGIHAGLSTYSTPGNLVNVNGTIFLTLPGVGTDIQLLKTDGTAPGTILLKDNINAANLTPGPGNILYFSGNDGTHGTELWKSDGTQAGTVMVKDINTGTADASPSSLITVGNNVFFFAKDASSGSDYGIFKTDGTAAGTVNVAYFPGNNAAYPIYQSGSYLYAITASNGPAGGAGQLWSCPTSQLLPVQLLSFTAKANGNDADCNWQTTHEINTDHFTVERSTDGINFTAIGSVNAKGNGSSVEQSYTYTDYNAKQLQYTTLYYRLQSVDKDGSSSYSTVAPVTFTDNNTFGISPNPATNRITVHGNNLVTIQIIDNAGKTVITQQLNNTNSTGIDISSLSKGLYFVQMKDNKGNIQTEKLVVE